MAHKVKLVGALVALLVFIVGCNTGGTNSPSYTSPGQNAGAANANSVNVGGSATTFSANEAIICRSSDTSVATVVVSNDGRSCLVTGVAAGEATISIAQAFDTNYSAAATKRITVHAQNYNVDPGPTGSGLASFLAAGDSSSATFNVPVNCTSDNSNVTVSGNGSTGITITAANVTTNQSAIITCTNPAGGDNGDPSYSTIIAIQGNTPPPPPLAIAANTPTTLAYNGTLTIQATGGTAPYTWSASPATIATIDANGVLTPVNNTPGGNVVITVTDAAGNSASHTVAVDVTPVVPPPPLAIAANTPTTLAYNHVLSVQASGGTAPYTWSASPATIATIDANGVLVPVTNTPGGGVVITVQDAAGNSDSHTIVIGAAPTEPVTDPLVWDHMAYNSGNTVYTTVDDSTFSLTPEAPTGGSGDYTFELANGDDLGGLELNPGTGAITGPATYAVTDTVTIIVSDEDGAEEFATFKLVAVYPVQATANGQTDSHSISVNAGQSVAIDGDYIYGSDNVTCTITNANLPADLSIDAGNCDITGTVAAGVTGTYTATVTATDNNLGTSDTVTVTLTIDDPTLTDAAFTNLTAALEHNGTLDVATAGAPTGNPSTFTYTLISGGEYATLEGSTLTAIAGTGLGTVIVEVSNGIERVDGETDRITVTKADSKLLFVDDSGQETSDYGIIIPSNGDMCITGETPVSFTLKAQGGTPDYEFSLGSGFNLATDLPGLSLNQETGVISGTPSSDIIKQLTFVVDDQAEGRDSVIATINCGDPLALDYDGGINTDPSTAGADDNTVTYLTSEGATVSASTLLNLVGGVNPTCSDNGTLPSSLSVDASTCEITGTIAADTAGTHTSTITVSSSDGQSAEVQITYDIKPALKLVNANTMITLESTADDEAVESGNAEDTTDTLGGTRFDYVLDFNNDNDGNGTGLNDTAEVESTDGSENSLTLPITGGDNALVTFNSAAYASCELLNANGENSGLKSFSVVKGTNDCTISLNSAIDGDTDAASGSYLLRITDADGGFVDIPVALTLHKALQLTLTNNGNAIDDDGTVDLAFTAADNRDAHADPGGGILPTNAGVAITPHDQVSGASADRSRALVDTQTTADTDNVDIDFTVANGKEGYTITTTSDGNGNELSNLLISSDLHYDEGSLTGVVNLSSDQSSISANNLHWSATDFYGAEADFDVNSITLYPELDVFCVGTSHQEIDTTEANRPISIVYDSVNTTTGGQTGNNIHYALTVTGDINYNRNFTCLIQGGDGDYTVSNHGALPSGLVIDTALDTANQPIDDTSAPSDVLENIGWSDNLQIVVKDGQGTTVESNVFRFFVNPIPTLALPHTALTHNRDGFGAFLTDPTDGTSGITTFNTTLTGGTTNNTNGYLPTAGTSICTNASYSIAAGTGVVTLAAHGGAVAGVTENATFNYTDVNGVEADPATLEVTCINVAL